jgi:5-methylthioadenosine/S-adenosylhomocysteine deaminase
MPSDSRAPLPCDLLVRNGYVITMAPDRTIYPSGAVAIAAGKIIDVGPDRTVHERYAPRRVIDAGGAPVHPGFVECHVHLLHTARGAFPADSPRQEGRDLYARWWDSQTEDEDHSASVLACVEMVRNGVTCFMDAGTAVHPDATAEAAQAVGIRASLADPFLWDRGYGMSPTVPLARAPVSLDRSLDALGGQLWRNDDPDGLVKGHIAVYGMGAASIELLSAAKSRADEARVVFAQHQSWQPADVEAQTAEYGMPPLLYFEQRGLLGSNCSFAHMNVLTDAEVTAVSDSGMSVVWCVTSSMVWGVGGTHHGKHSELHRAGVPVGLGADAPNSSCRFDPGLQSLFAILTAREKNLDRAALSTEDALEMMTVSGARAVGMEGGIGSLEIGKRADLVIRTDSVPEARTVDPLQGIVFSAGGRSVDTVIVDGTVVVESGHASQVDEAAAFAKASEASRRIMRRLGIGRVSQRWPEVI